MPKKPEEVNLSIPSRNFFRQILARVSRSSRRGTPAWSSRPIRTHDLLAHVDRINMMCEDIDYSKMTVEHFKCLVLASSLRSPEFSEILSRLLSKLEREENATLKDLETEIRTVDTHHQNLRSVHAEHSVHAVRHQPRNGQRLIRQIRQTAVSTATVQTPSLNRKSPPPPSACKKCGDLHWHRDCPYFRHTMRRLPPYRPQRGYCYKDNASVHSNDSEP